MWQRVSSTGAPKGIVTGNCGKCTKTGSLGSEICNFITLHDLVEICGWELSNQEESNDFLQACRYNL